MEKIAQFWEEQKKIHLRLDLGDFYDEIGYFRKEWTKEYNIFFYFSQISFISTFFYNKSIHSSKQQQRYVECNYSTVLKQIENVK